MPGSRSAVAVAFLATFRVTLKKGSASSTEVRRRVLHEPPFVTRPGFEWGSTLLDERERGRPSDEIYWRKRVVLLSCSLYASRLERCSPIADQGNSPTITGITPARSLRRTATETFFQLSRSRWWHFPPGALVASRVVPQMRFGGSWFVNRRRMAWTRTSGSSSR